MRTFAVLALGTVILGVVAQNTDVAMPIGWFRSTRTTVVPDTTSAQGRPSIPTTGGLVGGGVDGKGGDFGGFGGHGAHSRDINDFDRFLERNVHNQGRHDFRGQFAIKLFGEALTPVEWGSGYSAADFAAASWRPSTELQSVFVSAVGQLCIDNTGGCTAQLLVNAGGIETFLIRSHSCRVTLGRAGQGFLDARFDVKGGDKDGIRDVFPRRLVATFVAESLNEFDFIVNGCHNGYKAHGTMAEAQGYYNSGGSRYGRCNIVQGDDSAGFTDLLPVSLIGKATRQGFGHRDFKGHKGGLGGIGGGNVGGIGGIGGGVGGIGGGHGGIGGLRGGHKGDFSELETCQHFPEFALGINLHPKHY